MKTLVCLNTCNRLDELKKNIIPFLLFCRDNKGFDFVLSLDGNNKDYIDFCENYNIPLLYSLEREGVGLSKNRVLKQFPDYDYYFFIDDDVELINLKVFELFINNHKKFNYHHLSYSVNDDKLNIVNNQVDLVGGYKGGGCFNFYTKKAIERVGGWHTLFAKYKRFGHTEHSYRVFYSGLNSYPYLAVSNISNFLILNDPPHVTNLSIEQNKNELISEEQAMIDAKQIYFPLTTLSEFYFNGEDVSIPQLHPDLQKGRYALLKGWDKIKAWGNYYFHKYKATNNPFYFLIGFILFPNNNLLKHYMKSKLKAWKNNP